MCVVQTEQENQQQGSADPRCWPQATGDAAPGAAAALAASPYSWSQVRVRAVFAVAAGMGLAWVMWVLMRTLTAAPEQAELQPHMRATAGASTLGPTVEAPPAVPAVQTAARPAEPAQAPTVHVEVAEPIELLPAVHEPVPSAQPPRETSGMRAATAERKPARERVRSRDAKPRGTSSQPRRIYRKLDF